MSSSRKFGSVRVACGTALVMVAVACSKAKPANKTPTAALSAAAGPTAVSMTAPPEAGSALALPWAHTPVDRSTLKAPPLTPPTDAKAGEGGVYSQVLQPGEGDLPRPVDTIIVEFSMWTKDGNLAMSSYTEPQSSAFSLATVGPELRSLLAPLKKGAKVRYWLPRAALASWRPADWPDADLIIEVEVLNLTHISISDSTGRTIDPVPFQAPDAAGPPSNATATASGLRYVYLAHSSTVKHPKPGERLELRLDAYAIDGLTVATLQQGLKTATTLERAPGNLSEVLTQLNDGDSVRVWLPMGVGRQVIPSAGSRDVVLDLMLAIQN